MSLIMEKNLVIYTYVRTHVSSLCVMTCWAEYCAQGRTLGGKGGQVPTVPRLALWLPIPGFSVVPTPAE